MFDIEGFVNRNFQDVISYGEPLTDLRINCPYCSDFKHHLYVSLVKQLVHCFKCGYKRNWVGFVMDVTGLPYWRAISEIYYKTRLSNIGMYEEIKPVNEVKLPKDFEYLLDSKHAIAKLAIRYLYRRGFDDKHIARYNLGIALSVPARIIIPIEDDYWQGRALFNWMEPKYINPKSESKDIIFNSQALDDYDEVVICEGAFSAMAVGLNAIALIGKEPTSGKIYRILKSSIKRFIVTIEPDAVTMYKLADALKGDGREVIIWKYNQGDPVDSIDYDVMPWTFKNKVSILLEN